MDRADRTRLGRISSRGSTSLRRSNPNSCGVESSLDGPNLRDNPVKLAHQYRTTLAWDGAGDTGTSSYAVYGRNYRVRVEGKPDIEASADPAFRGARKGIHVVAYEDAATGTMEETPDGGGRFTEVVLHPSVTIAEGDADLAAALHDKAHALCYVANSCSVPIRHHATIHEATR